MNSGGPKKILDNPEAEVAVVFDPDFGDRLKAIWPGRAVWIVSSPANEPIIKMFWAEYANEGVVADTCITSFKPNERLGAEEFILVILSDIDQHHGASASAEPYRRLNVIGASPTPRVAKELMRLGFDDLSVTPQGFLATRNKEASTKIYD